MIKYNISKNIGIKTKKWLGLYLILIYLIIGLVIVKDYGQATDTNAQLRHSRINYRHIISHFKSLIKSENTMNFIERTEDLETYGGKYYGVAIQLPLVAIEHINNFNLDSSVIFKIRNTYIFLNYVIGCLCFYLLLRMRFGDKYITILGLLMLLLYPRFFGLSFVDIKNIVFVSWYIISIYFSFRFLKNQSIINMLLFSLVTAICTNIRTIGLSIYLLTFSFYVFNLVYKQKINKNLLIKIAIRIIILIISFLFFFKLITPASWNTNIFEYLYNYIIKFKDFEPHSRKFIFMGELINKNVPWYYIPVWMVITIPVIYSILFCYGTYKKIYNIIKFRKNGIRYLIKNYMFDIYIFILLFVSYFGLILLKAVFYVSWQHTYFLFIPFLFIAIYGLNDINLNINKKIIPKIINISLIIVLILNLLWIIKNHPYQAAYFNIPSRKNIVYKFERGNGTCITHLCKYILEIDNRNRINIMGEGLSRRGILVKEERDRIRVVRETDNADYVILNARGRLNNEWKIDGFTEIKNISIDGYKLGAVFKRIE